MLNPVQSSCLANHLSRKGIQGETGNTRYWKRSQYRKKYLNIWQNAEKINQLKEKEKAKR